MWTGSGPVPAHADFLLRTRVGATASVSYGRSASSGLSSSASATLGEDTASATASAPGDVHSQSVPGAHLKRVTASGGVVTLSLSGNVTTDASNSLPYEKWWTQDNRSWYYDRGGNGATSASASGSASATAYPDSRDVAVSSSLEPTYSKGADNIPVANTRASDGSITDDTVVPDPATGTSISYEAHRAGTWGSDSNYSWTSSLINDSDAGVFNSSSWFGNKTIPDFYVVYTNPPATAGQSDTVTLTLTDGSDGSTGSNTATVRFHAAYENWQRDASKTVQHPTLLNQNGAINPDGDWADLGPIDNPSPAPLTQAIGRSYSFTKTQTGTIGGQVSLGPAGIAAFQTNESIVVGKTSTATLSETTTFTAAPWTRTECFEAPFWEERHGTCDVYGEDGYQGNADWTGVYASNPLPLRPGQAVTYVYPH